MAERTPILKPRSETADLDPADRANWTMAEMPASKGDIEPMLKSLGKPISELLGLILTPTQSKTGVPKQLRLSNFDSMKGNVQFHGDSRAASPRFEASPAQLDDLINGGALDVAQPPQGAVDRIRKILSALLDSAP